ncbi:NnrS family protein [Azospirillum brasilense]|nr:NnrS family protein [Azospirillum brasilense]
MTPTTLLRYGFRPFVLLGAVGAAALIAVWVPWFLGLVSLQMELPPVSWHAHEMLFGVVPGILGGLLLTATPRWAGRPPVAGWLPAALVVVWIMGRLGVVGSEALGPLGTALLNVLFPVALTIVTGREIVAARNWCDLKMLGLLGILVGAQSLFHWELWRFGQSTHGTRLAVATSVTLIMLIGGRIIPNLARSLPEVRVVTRRPTPFSRFDRGATGLGMLALAAWTLRDDAVLDARLTGALLLIAGLAQAARILRWRPHRRLTDPLALVLHIAYGFIPVGFLLAAWAALAGSPAHGGAALHAWTVGAIGGMMPAMMARVPPDHAGRPLTAFWPFAAISLAVIVAAGTLIAAVLDPQRTMQLMPLSGILWAVAFLMFGIVTARRQHAGLNVRLR